MIDIKSKLTEDIRLRGMSEITSEAYQKNVKRYLDFLGDIPIESTSEIDIRRYSTYLREERGLTPRTVNTYLAAVIFLYEVTLDRQLNIRQVPRMRVPKSLPAILSRSELETMLETTTNLKHRAILSLGYGSGLRISEVCNLKISDIDSEEMRLFVRKGKGNKDRYTLLSEASLTCLREYWRAYRPNHPEGWLFTGHHNYTKICTVACNHAFKAALQRIDVDPKRFSFHTLRHCFATHMLEDGVSLVTIKELLGHSALSSTMVYLHLANVSKGLVSPLDKVMCDV